MNKQVDFLVKLRDAAAMMAEAANEYIQTMVPPEATENQANEEVLTFVRQRFIEGKAEEWIQLATEAGLTPKRGEELFESLKGKELFWYDKQDGTTVWRWNNT